MRFLLLALVLGAAGVPLGAQITAEETTEVSHLVGTLSGSVFRVQPNEGTLQYLFNIGAPVGFLQAAGERVYALPQGGDGLYRWSPDQSPALTWYRFDGPANQVLGITSNASETASLVVVGVRDQEDSWSQVYLVDWRSNRVTAVIEGSGATFVAEDRVALWGKEEWSDSEVADEFEIRTVILNLDGESVPGTYTKLPEAKVSRALSPKDDHSPIPFSPREPVLWTTRGVEGVGSGLMPDELIPGTVEIHYPVSDEDPFFGVEYMGSANEGKTTIRWTRKFQGKYWDQCTSPSGKIVAVAYSRLDGVDPGTLIGLLDARTGKTLREIPLSPGMAWDSRLRFGASDDVLAVRTGDSWAQWSSRLGRWIGLGPNNAFAVFSDGTFLRSGPQGTIERTTSQGGERRLQIYGPPAQQKGGTIAVAVSPTGQTFLTVDEGETVYVREVSTGALLAVGNDQSNQWTPSSFRTLEAKGAASAGKKTVPVVLPFREVTLKVPQTASH